MDQIARCTSTTIIPLDGTTPQITEGFEVYRKTLKPTSKNTYFNIHLKIPVRYNKGVVRAIIFSDNKVIAIGNSSQSGYDEYGFKEIVIKTGLWLTKREEITVRVGNHIAGTVTIGGNGFIIIY